MQGESYHPDEEATQGQLEARLAPDKIALDWQQVRDLQRQIEASGELETERVSVPGALIEGATLPAKAPDRKKNEDAIFAFGQSSTGFFSAGVLDGVSGQSQASEASHLLKEEILRSMLQLPPQATGNPVAVLKAVQAASENFRSRLDRQGPAFEDADTTISMVFGLPHQGQMRLFVISQGDSPVYMRDAKGLRKLTEDDSFVARLSRSGAISDLEAKVHPMKNQILSSARHPRKGQNAQSSIPDFPYHVQAYDLPIGATVLLASDGLTDQFREDPACNELEGMLDADLTPTGMLAAAKIRERQRIEGLSKNDDVSVVKITIGSAASYEADQSRRQDTIANPGGPASTLEQIEGKANQHIFEKIRMDRQLGSFLAEAVLGKWDLRGELEPMHIAEFYEKFPNHAAFQRGFDLAGFLARIERGNGPAKRGEYERKASEFTDLMYHAG